MSKPYRSDLELYTETDYLAPHIISLGPVHPNCGNADAANVVEENCTWSEDREEHA
jgi:hypothetical protein